MKEQCSPEEERMVYEAMLNFTNVLMDAINTTRLWSEQYNALRRNESE